MSKMIGALAGLSNSDGSPIAIVRETPQQDESSSNTQGGAKEATICEILVKIFLPHPKGEKREHCSLGHCLELSILKNWIEKSQEALHNVSVKGAFMAGLAAKKDAEFAKYSIDFILAVKEEGEMKMWGFEAKVRVTSGTAAHKERDLNYAIFPHIRIDEQEVEDQVHNVGEHFQILQHAYVYGFDTVVLAISDRQSELIQSLAVEFTNDLKEHFGAILSDLKDIALNWLYEEIDESNLSSTRRDHYANQVISVPTEIQEVATDIPTINGFQKLQGTVNLWKAMVDLPKPIPSMHHVIPAIYEFWNSVKGCSDTTTKLMDDCLIQIPKCHMNTETVAISRCGMVIFVLFHCLSQVQYAEANLNYPSLHHYRHAASFRSTFHASLLRCAKISRMSLATMTIRE